MQPNTKTGKALHPASASPKPTEGSPPNADARGLREQLVSERTREQRSDAAAIAERLAKLREVVRRFDTLPILDGREPDEILGYDEAGLPS